MPHAVALLLISLLAMPVALLLPVPLKIAVDNVIGDKPLPGWLEALLPSGMETSTSGLTVAVALLLVAITLIGELVALARTVFGTYTGERLLLSFRRKLFGHGQRLSLTYHDAVGTADASYRIQWDAWSIRTVLLEGTSSLVAAFATVVAMLAVILSFDWQLGLIALCVAPAMFALTWLSRRRLRGRWSEVKEVESSSLSVIQETLTSLRVVKAFGREEHEEDRFATRALVGANLHVRLMLIESLLGLALVIVTAVGTGLVLYVGVRQVESGVLTLGTLLLIMGYLSQLYSPLQTIAREIASLQGAFASGERALTLLDQASDVPEPKDPVMLSRARGAIRFENVSFSYDEGRPVLHDVSFTVEPGTRVGIAGRTGSGKTTLMSLLMRFYDPTRGHILLDDVDIRSYRLDELRDQFAIVLQEPVLFSTSIAENIAYGRPGADISEIVAAATAANAHDFITGLSDGYDTLVGERGMRLSGGERQRISLARAFLKDAPILILDEPTSSVDVKTEAAIMEATQRLLKDRTTFMIAHRLSTLRACDTYLQLSQGSIVSTDPPHGMEEDVSGGGAGTGPGAPRPSDGLPTITVPANAGDEPQ